MAIQLILPIRYANLLAASQDVAILLPASQHMNHHLSAGIFYQLADLYQLPGFKSQQHFLTFELNDYKFVVDV